MTGLDLQVGIGAYSTAHPGIGGRIRESPDDFVVTETLSGTAQRAVAAGGPYAVYVLRKRGIDTAHALSDLRRRGMRLKALGLKDASAVTAQFVCSTRRGPHAAPVDAPRYSLEPAGSSARPLSRGDMAANHFTIRIRGCSDPASFGEYSRILNFYGYQRFGSARPVTHLVGRAMVRGDYAGAVESLVSFGIGGAAEALAAGDHAECARLLPSGMDVERTVLRELGAGSDPLRALRAVPVSMRRFYVQAYQSYIFNRTLSAAYLAGEEMFEARDGDVCYDPGDRLGKYAAGTEWRLAVPFVGYGYYKKTRFDPYIREVLLEEGVDPGDFFLGDMDDASGEAGFRQAAVRCTDCTARGDTVGFTLSRGSFATVVLREMIKPADPAASGF